MVGGGSIAVGKYHLGLITHAFSDSCAVYREPAIRSGVGRESQLDLLPFVCQRTAYRRRVPTLVRHMHHGWDPLILPVFVVYDGLYGISVYRDRPWM